MAITEEQRQWAFDLINPSANYEGLYPDVVEQVIDYAETPKKIIVVAIDEGNPPVVPLKQLAFWLKCSDDENQDLIGFEFKLLNPDEVENGASRPAQFAAHLPADYMADLIDEDNWISFDDEDCEDCHDAI
jgi:hypothetical protein